MIQNQHQYQVTQNKLKDLKQSLVELEEIKDTLHPRQFSGRKNGLVKSINALQQEIAESELDIYNSHADQYWNKEAQLRKNQPLMKLVKQWQQKKNGKPATEREIQEYLDIQESLKRN